MLRELLKKLLMDYITPARTDYKIVNTFVVDGRISRTDAYNLQTRAL
jgi:hypothetical protein